MRESKGERLGCSLLSYDHKLRKPENKENQQDNFVSKELPSKRVFRYSPSTGDILEYSLQGTVRKGQDIAAGEIH